MPGPYNNNYHIVQNPDAGNCFDFRGGEVHEARLIPLGGRAHLAPDIRQLMGDPRSPLGKANTLVVDSTNFNNDTKFRNAGPKPALNRAIHADGSTNVASLRIHRGRSRRHSLSRGPLPCRKAPTRGPLLEDECHEGRLQRAGGYSKSSACRREESP